MSEARDSQWNGCRKLCQVSKEVRMRWGPWCVVSEQELEVRFSKRTTSVSGWSLCVTPCLSSSRREADAPEKTAKRHSGAEWAVAYFLHVFPCSTPPPPRWIGSRLSLFNAALLDKVSPGQDKYSVFQISGEDISLKIILLFKWPGGGECYLSVCCLIAYPWGPAPSFIYC